MRLDRNTGDGKGKYAVVMLRKVEEIPDTERAPIAEALAVLHNAGVLTYGYEGTATEFFVLMLKDKHAGGALAQYAMHAVGDDPEYARDIMTLTNRAGENSLFCKKPD